MHITNAQTNMLKRQIREGFVTDDHILDTIKSVPREFFIPEKYKHLAYVDMQIPIGHHQITLRPQEEALMLQALNIKTTDNVLEIGTGTGYLTALLAKLARRVTSVDIFADFVTTAKTKLLKQGLHNITLTTQDITREWFDNTSFDVIIITSAVPHLPKQYLQTLTLAGRLFAILGEQSIMTATVFYHPVKQDWTKKTLFETRVPPIITAEKREKFSF